MYEKNAKLFKALSDNNRLLILELLIKGESCGCTLIDKLTISQPTMSYHLNILAESGLTTICKDGVWKKHHVNMNKIDELIAYLTSLKYLEVTCEND